MTTIPLFRSVPRDAASKLIRLPSEDTATFPEYLLDSAVDMVRATSGEGVYNQRVIEFLRHLLPQRKRSVPSSVEYSFGKGDATPSNLKGLRVVTQGAEGVQWSETRIARDYAECLGLYVAMKERKLHLDNLAERFQHARKSGLIGPYVPDIVGYASAMPSRSTPSPIPSSRGSLDNPPTSTPAPASHTRFPSAPSLAGDTTASLPTLTPGGLPSPSISPDQGVGSSRGAKRRLSPPKRSNSQAKRQNPGVKTALSFLVGEMKLKLAELLYGLTKGMSYLHATHEVCGCWISVLVVGERFARMIQYEDDVIVLETGDQELVGQTVTAAELIDKIRFSHLPWSFGSFDQEADEWDLDSVGIRCFWNTAYLAASLVADLPYDQPLQRLPRPDADALPAWAQLRRSLDDSLSTDVSTTVSRLALYAHADKAPKRGRLLASLEKLVTDWGASTEEGAVDWQELLRRLESQSQDEAGQVPQRGPREEDDDGPGPGPHEGSSHQASAPAQVPPTTSSATTEPVSTTTSGGDGQQPSDSVAYRSATPPLTYDTSSSEGADTSLEHSSGSSRLSDPAANGPFPADGDEGVMRSKDWPMLGEGPDPSDSCDEEEDEELAEHQTEIEYRIMAVVLCRLGIKVTLVDRDMMTRLIEEGAGGVGGAAGAETSMPPSEAF